MPHGHLSIAVAANYLLPRIAASSLQEEVWLQVTFFPCAASVQPCISFGTYLLVCPVQRESGEYLLPELENELASPVPPKPELEEFQTASA